MRTGTGQRDNAHLVVLRRRVERLAQLRPLMLIEGVHLLGAIEADPAQTALVLDLQCREGRRHEYKTPDRAKDMGTPHRASLWNLDVEWLSRVRQGCLRGLQTPSVNRSRAGPAPYGSPRTESRRRPVRCRHRFRRQPAWPGRSA